MKPSACRVPGTAHDCTVAVRRAGIPGVWGVIGFIYSGGASLPVACAAVCLAAGLGAAIVRLAGEDTRWTSLLAAPFLLCSPLVQKYWVMAREESFWIQLMLLKTVVIVAGLLVLARLGAGRQEEEEKGAPQDTSQAAGP